MIDMDFFSIHGLIEVYSLKDLNSVKKYTYIDNRMATKNQLTQLIDGQ